MPPRQASRIASGPAVRIIRSSDRAVVAALVDRRPARKPEIERTVAEIVARVRRHGDRALMEYARRFDGLQGPVEVTRQEIRDAARQVEPRVRRAIGTAAANIRRVSQHQVPRSWSMSPVAGVRIMQRVVPLDRVGCYVPGGRYPLPSSLLMTAIPAVVAGVPEVIAVCPRPDPAVLYAASVAGVARMFRVGGAHAIAGLAYGTETIPRVDKIVGPGNAYVAAAKAQVAAECGIDFFAGPSEIVVVSTDGVARWIAADLIAQAEHDPDARALLLTPSVSLALAVGREIEEQIASVPAARPSLRQNGGIIVTASLDDAIALSQQIAPEHAVCDSESVARRLTRAGTTFAGKYSAQACGDYVTGSNHVLPTSGAASARGGLSAADFVRVSTIQRLTLRGLHAIGPAAIALAEAEGLAGHAASVRVRLQGSRARQRTGARQREDR